jgi:aryl-alcohol dehydrogenase-like predicted oxidoreductase
MIRRPFGEGATVSVLGIGCSRVGSISNPTPMREIEATLETAAGNGITLFDTANIYGQGDSERALGRLLLRHGDRILVVTKVGGRLGRLAPVIRYAKPLLRLVANARPRLRGAVVAARTAAMSQAFSPAFLLPEIDASRRRLGLDRLHGLLLHDPSVETLRSPEIADFLAELLRSGKAQRVGVSIDNPAALNAALAIPAVSLIQAPLALVQALNGSAALGIIRERKTAIIVREVLRKSASGQGGRAGLTEALSAAISPDIVASAIVGVSTRQHLAELLESLP